MSDHDKTLLTVVASVFLVMFFTCITVTWTASVAHDAEIQKTKIAAETFRGK